MIRQGRPSLRGRFLVMSALSSTLALLLACAGFLTYEILTFRKGMVDDLSSDAEVLSFNVAAPLLFDDPAAATTSLSALRAKPSIRSATVLGRRGEVFASYGTLERMPAPLASTEQRSHLFEHDRLWLRVPVASEGSVIGALVLEATLDEHYQRIRRYILLSGAILLCALIAALGVSGWMQRRVLQPILALTEAAGRVSRKQDYSVRVDARSEDELGLLARTFNDMLEQIEHQNTDLKQAVRMRDEFLSVASHELKTPLTSLQLQVQAVTLQAKREQTEWIQPKMQVLIRQVHRLGRLVDELLDISRLSIRKVELTYEQVDLAQLVTDVIEQFQTEASRKGCELIVRAPEPVTGRWDAARLEQVIVNLVSNALKYGIGAPIELAVGSGEGHAIFSVRDHGIGIREEDHARIFDRFERAVSDRHYGGFGLGLWIVREIVQSFGGSVRVESQPGEGACFIVDLPLGTEPRDERSATAAAHALNGGA